MIYILIPIYFMLPSCCNGSTNGDVGYSDIGYINVLCIYIRYYSGLRCYISKYIITPADIKNSPIEYESLTTFYTRARWTSIVAVSHGPVVGIPLKLILIYR